MAMTLHLFSYLSGERGGGGGGRGGEGGGSGSMIACRVSLISRIVFAIDERHEQRGCNQASSNRQEAAQRFAVSAPRNSPLAADTPFTT